MRTLIDIPEKQLQALAAICATEQVSRAEAVRQAISLYLETKTPATTDVFGLWQKQPIDGMAYQELVRSEW